MKVKSTIFDLLLSGALGNVVAGKAKGGIEWLRSRVTPSNPGSSAQAAVRAALSSLAGHWRDTLTQAQRDAWDTYAAGVTKGGLVLSGQSWYIGANALRAYVETNSPATLSAVRIDDGPTNISRAVLSPCTCTVTGSSGDLSIAFEVTDEWNTAVDGGLLVTTRGPISPSQQFNAGNNIFQSFLEGAVSPPTSPQVISGAFVTASAGQRYFIDLQAMTPDGRYSPVQRFSVLGG